MTTKEKFWFIMFIILMIVIWIGLFIISKHHT